MYIKALDADGTSWAPPVTVDNDGSVGTYTSMTIVNGEPAISYINGIDRDLKYVRMEGTTPSRVQVNWMAVAP
ncbi:MAG: hypothetical protein GKR87_11635 [Kiritimatiellae bacterium]|nr:hypothetical protein [Kiritimatiellia bacterium]